MSGSTDSNVDITNAPPGNTSLNIEASGSKNFQSSSGTVDNNASLDNESSNSENFQSYCRSDCGSPARKKHKSDNADISDSETGSLSSPLKKKDDDIQVYKSLWEKEEKINTELIREKISLKSQIIKKERELKSKDKEIHFLWKSKDKEIQFLKSKLKSKDEEIQFLESKFKAKDEEIQSLDKKYYFDSSSPLRDPCLFPAWGNAASFPSKKFDIEYCGNGNKKNESDWSKEKYHGEGKGANYDRDEHIQYDGNWSKDKRHGKGIYKFANGRKYDGEWENDKKEGHGVFTWPNRQDRVCPSTKATHERILNSNGTEETRMERIDRLYPKARRQQLEEGGGSAQREVGPTTKKTWQRVRGNLELIECIREVNMQLSQLSKIDWKNIEEKLKTDVIFCRCFESFFNVYDRMQGELGEPKRTRGLSYNANLTCIFYYYGEIEIYKTHYLCRLPCRIFKKHRDFMVMLLKNTIYT